MRELDFIVIGSGRSGTTALFMALRQHPQIYMPPQKGVPIDRTPVDEYMLKYFGGHEDRVMGKAVPSYMEHTGCAAITYSLWPKAKIIALLRHPIERAYSDWNMHVKAGIEHSDFDKAMRRQGNIYKRASLYGQILEPYFDLFGNVLVVFTKDLKEQPEMLISKIENFLDIDLFRPKNLDVRYNGSWQFRTPLQKVAQKIPGRKLLPLYWRHWFWWLLEIRKPKAIEEQKPDFSLYFDEDFHDDKELLEVLTGEKIPW